MSEPENNDGGSTADEYDEEQGEELEISEQEGSCPETHSSLLVAPVADD